MKVTRSAEAPWQDGLNQGGFANRRKDLGGDKLLSCGLWELAPGKKSFPLHAHAVTEEAMYVLSGRGQVRTPDGLTPIGPGDFVSFPAGGVAHQLVNDGKEPLVYVAISSNAAGADVVEYPDSKKVGVMVGRWPNAKRFLLKTTTQQPEYLEDEPDA